MTFISSSEASQSNSQILSISQDTIQALALLLKSLFDQKEKEKEKEQPSQNLDKSEVSESKITNTDFGSDMVLSSSDSLARFDYSDTPLSDTPLSDIPPSLDSGGQLALPMDDFRQEVMAGVAVALVANFGEDGVYQAEDYLIKSSESSDGQNVYEIFDNQGELIAGFTFDPNADVSADYFIDVSPIDTQIDFVETAYNTVQIDMADLASDSGGYLAAVDALGDLAPAGSRGVILVENALSITGKNDFHGQTYSFHKDAEGDLTISSNQSKTPILQTKDGHISNQTLSSVDLAKFKEVFKQMKDDTPVLAASKGGLER